MWDCGACGCMAIAASVAACPMCGKEREVPKTTIEGPSYEEGKEPPGWVPGQGDQAAPDLPAKSAPKADWVDAAVAVAGVDPDEAASMTKPALQETVQAAVPPPPPAES